MWKGYLGSLIPFSENVFAHYIVLCACACGLLTAANINSCLYQITAAECNPVCCLIPSRVKRFAFLQYVHTDSRPHPPSCQWMPGVKWLEHEAYHSLAGSAKVQNERSHTSTSRTCPRCVDTDNFTFLQCCRLRQDLGRSACDTALRATSHTVACLSCMRAFYILS